MCIEAIDAMLRNSEQKAPGPRLVLWCIAWHINRDSGDWPITIQEMMNETALRKTQLYFHLKTLEESGELIITHRRYRPSVYRLSYFAGRFATDEEADELSTNGELSTLISGGPELAAHTNFRRAGNYNHLKSGPPEITTTLNPARRKLERRIPYTGISLPEEERPEGDPYANSVENLMRSRQGPFAAWQRAQAAQRRAQ